MAPQFLELYLRAEAIKIEVQSMLAANEERARRGEAQACPEKSFLQRSVELNNIADFVHQIAQANPKL